LCATRQAIAGTRGFDTSSDQTMDRMLSSLLVEMDGAGGRDEGVVMVIAATDHPSLLDPAILRPGRFDLHIQLPFPDEPARRAILTGQLQGMPLEGTVEAVVEGIMGRTRGMSGAELKSLCQEAGLRALREDLNAAAVGARHLEAALGGH
jgi:ATP-dependent 26S proteasome regulatory subunit